MFDWLRNLIDRLLDLLCRFFGFGCRCKVPSAPASCPITWQPSVMAPVFYGARDLGEPPVVLPAIGPGGIGPIPLAPPGKARVFFPSLDGAVFEAPILEGCARYPLILFCPGSCPTEATHYKKWFTAPATIARSGYVVLVADLPEVRGGVHPSGADGDLDLLGRWENWIRTQWEHRSVLLPDRTGVIGHSFGALLAARYALNGKVGAYASLSGVWQDWPDANKPIKALAIPKFFTWGAQEFGLDFFTEIAGAEWTALPRNKHRAVFPGAGHWDYLPNGATVCQQDRGPCNLVGTVARELAATFFGKYLPPENWPNLPTCLPDSLIAPARNLTFEQEFYNGSHLKGLAMMAASPGCRVQIAWETNASSGSATRP